MLKLVFELDDPIGKTIVTLIKWVFWIGVINYIIHFLRLGWEYASLKIVQIKTKRGLDVTSADYINKLSKSVIFSKGISISTICRRIRDLITIKQNEGQIDHDVLGDIHAGAASRRAGLSNYILGVLIILGLVGTLYGLTTAVVEVQPLLEDIEELDQLPQISQALRETLKGMGTAFKTTLAGLVTSLGLGVFGWLFNLVNSSFLTKFETVISTDILPHFMQAPETAIESSMVRLNQSVDEFKLVTEHNVSELQKSIQQLAENPFDEFLTQLFANSEQWKATHEELRESLENITGYEVLIKGTVDEFKDTTANSMSKISEFMSKTVEYQKELLKAVPKFEEESHDLKETIRSSQIKQAEFIEDLSARLKQLLQSIIDSQTSILSQISQMTEVLVTIASGLDIRSALEKQNEVFEGIRTELILNRQEMGNTLAQLIGTLALVIEALDIKPTLEEQNKVMGRIESHLKGQRELVDEQKGIMQTLDGSITRLEQTFKTGEKERDERIDKMIQQFTYNFTMLTEQMDTLNNTMSKPGLYRWGREIRSWYRSLRKKR